MISNRMDGAFDFLGNALEYLLKGLGFAFDTLGSIIDVPMNVLAQGVDIAFNGVAGLLESIPLIGELLSGIVLVGGAIIKFGLTLPGLLLHGFANLLEGFAKALDEALTPAEKQKNMEEQKKKTIDKAPDSIKENVKSVLDAAGIGAGNTSSDVKKNATDGKATTGDSGTTNPNDPRVQAEAQKPQESFLDKALPVAIPVAAGGIILALILH